MQSKSSKRFLGPFSLAMIAIIAIIDLRSMAMMATYGLSCVLVYGLAMLLFLIPIGLVCAELSTNIRQVGGMYAWIHINFGEKLGFFAIWLEWINNVISFPALMSFIVVTLIYFLNPELTHHKFLVLTLTLSVLWLNTIYTLLGVKASSRLTVLGALLGTVIPALIIAGLGITWFVLERPLQIHFALPNLLPTHGWNPGFFAAIILSFGGMQIIAFHSANVYQPKKSYPRAIFVAVLAIVIITMITALSIASVVPHNDLNLVSGLSLAFKTFFKSFHMQWATPILSLLIVLSAIATLNAWFLGPARGIVEAANRGHFPKAFAYVNKHDVPSNVILLQGVLCTLLCSVFLYFPDITSGFWVLLNLSSQSALVVYILIFAAGIKNRYNDRERSGFLITKSNLGMWIVAGTGILTCTISLIASLIPPTTFKVGNIWHYETVLLLSNAIFFSIPFFVNSYFAKKSKLTLISEIST